MTHIEGRLKYILIAEAEQLRSRKEIQTRNQFQLHKPVEVKCSNHQ
jgi:hypothetical protein